MGQNETSRIHQRLLTTLESSKKKKKKKELEVMLLDM